MAEITGPGYEFACNPECFIFQEAAAVGIDATPACTEQRQRMVDALSKSLVLMGPDDLCGGEESVELQDQIEAARMEIQHA